MGPDERPEEEFCGISFGRLREARLRAEPKSVERERSEARLDSMTEAREIHKANVRQGTQRRGEGQVEQQRCRKRAKEERATKAPKR